MLNWAQQFNIFCFLDNHQYYHTSSTVECLLAVGSIRQLQAPKGEGLNLMESFLSVEDEWVFGHLAYDLKNEIENLSSSNEDFVQFPDIFLFVPQVVIQLAEENISIGDFNNEADLICKQILNSSSSIRPSPVSATIKSRFTREEYVDIIKKLKDHILKGDFYEINFCQEFYDNNIIIDPLSTFVSLGKMSPNPFGAFYRLNDQYLLCESPERYLKKTQNHIFSQPIKGTWSRDLQDDVRDNENKISLQQNQKELSENVMVVDLVRNDLSKICEEGTVEVVELFGVYTFPQVHQLISTVKGILLKDTKPVDIIRATFPMGSMTGAPKKRVMEAIEQYERTKRGIFSGAVGYFTQDGDFDFNVVIRSILYNAASRYLSYQAGSGITFYCDAEKEYEECLLKVEVIKKVLTN